MKSTENWRQNERTHREMTLIILLAVVGILWIVVLVLYAAGVVK